MSKRLSIYVSSPDSYSDVFELFLKAFKKKWKNCPYELILTTNSNSYDGITCICNYKENDTWVERTLDALSQLQSKYILLMCDDLIIRESINNKEIDNILDYMDLHDIRYCRMKPLFSKDIINELPYLSKVKQQTPYAINLQIGIFRRDFFEEVLGDGSLSAWDIEARFIENSLNAQNDFFEDVVSVNKPVIPFVHGVIKGKWIRNSLRYIKNEYPEYEVRRERTSLMMQWKIDLMEWVRDRVTPKQKKRIKGLLRKLGFSFVTVN